MKTPLRKGKGLRPPRHIVAAAALGLCLSLVGCGVRSEPLSLAARWERGLRALSSYEFAQAQRDYRVLSAQLPRGDQRWPEAAYGLALSLWHAEPATAVAAQEAQALFEQISAHPHSGLWGQSAKMNLARMAMLQDYPGDRPDPAQALPLLAQLIETAQGPLRHEALLRWVEAQRMRVGAAEAVVMARGRLREWLLAHPSNPYAGLMWEQLAWMELLDIGDKAAALEAFVAAEANGLADPARLGLILWRIAELAHERGQNLRAARYYRRLILEAPASGRAYEAQQALRKMQAQEPGMSGLSIPDITLHGGGQ